MAPSLTPPLSAPLLFSFPPTRPTARSLGQPTDQPTAHSFTILAFTLLSGIYFGLFPSDRTHLNNVMAKIKADKGKEMKAFARKLDQQGGALSLV